MGGAIIGKKKYLDIIRAQSQVNLGATISPFNAWLIMRGAVTLPCGCGSTMPTHCRWQSTSRR